MIAGRWSSPQPPEANALQADNSYQIQSRFVGEEPSC
jgi:hypothetical protein